ncbi:MAG TPA: AAA family ATPase [Actinomycetota bacterium]|nr:AAA family ATPase [Actinomycetota bacterium]
MESPCRAGRLRWSGSLFGIREEGRLLIGREDEQEVIERLLAGVREGRSGALVILGEPGIGKSTLLGIARASAAGMTLLTSSGVESETEVPFAALHELLAPILDHLDAIPPVQQEALRAAVGLEASRPADRLLIGAAVLSLLAEAAADAPVACLVDDAHLLDEESATAIAFAARRLGAERVATIVAARESPQGALHRAGLPAIRLAPLSSGDASDLLTARREDLDREGRRVVLSAAAGNPLALLELPPTEDALGPIALPSRLEEAYVRRTASLPDATRRLLLLAAAEDSGDVAAILRASSSWGFDASDLGPAERARLVVVSGDRLAFRHPLMRSAIYRGATFEERRRAHTLLAEALSGDADRRARHRAAAAAGVDDEVADEMAAAGERALARGACARASSAFEVAARLCSRATVRCRRLARAAEAAWLSGDFDRCTDLFDRARAAASDPSVRALDAWIRGQISNTRGLPAAAAELVLAAARDPATTPTDVRRLALVGTEATIRLADVDGFRSFDDLVASLPAPTEPFDRLAADVLHGERELIEGDATRGAPLIRSAIERGADSDDARELFTTAVAALYVGEWTRSRSLFSRSAARARERGDLGSLASILAGLAAVEATLVELPQAEADATEAIDLASHANQENNSSYARACLSLVAAWRGHEARCRALAEDALELATARRLPVISDRATLGLGVLAFGEGDIEEALQHLAAISGPERSPAIRGQTLPLLVECAARAGDLDRATWALDELLPWATACASPDVVPVATRCRALLAEGDEAESLYREAIAFPGGAPIERARTELLLGEHLRRRKRRTEARPHLRAALEAFQRVGAVPWAERAASELRATGETARPRNVGTLTELTPQELQVARLAGERSTNREIAARLFLSPKTVEYHLGKVFAKLGVSSRTELIAMSIDAPVVQG